MENVTNVPTAAQQPAARKKNNIVIYYWGNGKGKTTAALGLALRASGYKKKILFAQFIKGDWKTGEDVALSRINYLVHKKFGLGFVYKTDDKARTDKHKKAVLRGLNFILDNYKKYDIIILDELANAVNLGLIDIKKIILAVSITRNKCTVVITGRPLIKELAESSDLITEMKKIIHPFDNGVTAIESIDW
jgi:cob(I)alamin adenosyltransferase